MTLLRHFCNSELPLYSRFKRIDSVSAIFRLFDDGVTHVQGHHDSTEDAKEAAHKSLGSVRKKSRFTSDKLSVHFGKTLGSFPLRERLTLAGGAARLPW